MIDDKTVVEILENAEKQAKTFKSEEPENEIPQFIIGLDESGAMLAAMPVKDIEQAAVITLARPAIENIQKKTLKKLTAEDIEKLMPKVCEQIRETRASKDLCFYYIGAKFKHEQEKMNKKISAFLHVAEAWGLTAKNEEEASKLPAPSKSPDRKELIAITLYDVENKKTYGKTLFFDRTKTGISYKAQEASKDFKSLEIKSSKISESLAQGYTDQKEAENNGEQTTPVEKIDALFRLALGDRLVVQEVAV